MAAKKRRRGGRGVPKNKKAPPGMFTMALPDDPPLLQAVGLVSLRHSQLDYALRMMIKTLTGVSIGEALNATLYTGSRELRRRVGSLARQRLGDGATLIRIQDLMARCEEVTEKRNGLIHEIWGVNSDGVEGVRTRAHQWRPLPTAAEMNGLAAVVSRLVAEINHVRLKGYLVDALAKSPIGRSPTESLIRLVGKSEG